ncbi:ATG11 domain-containing protein [Mycena indigotica]|uniref:Autophagy-related protein 11 n=1 Tax=Mycena indigotica TaxID=2126181 RepID=A0A8H6WF92_9AGAR|nr:ATG11 domain-containing protein [Mycena indigotica]KAF7316529.1 ATG11 domain-containing protein [Mycena indigotica]
MLQICRAEDGHVFQVLSISSSLSFEPEADQHKGKRGRTGHRTIRTGSLELFIQQETGIDQQYILAYLPDGRRLTNANLRELSGSQTQVRNYHPTAPHFTQFSILRELRIDAPLQPPIEDDIAATPPFRPSILASSYLRTAQIHRDHVHNLLSSIHCQHEAIQVALTSLEHNVLQIGDTFDSISTASRRELEKQGVLLAGVDSDLMIIGRVRIHPEFMSAAMRVAIEAGERPRTLGDYVSTAKMRSVAHTCADTHDQLQARFSQIERAVSQLQQGTHSVRSAVINTSLLDDAETCARRSQDAFDKISHSTGVLEGHVPDPDGVLQELRQLDFSLRQELQFIANIKNSYTQHSINALRTISMLNNDMVQIPPSLVIVQASFRNKNSFPHIQRLHNMLYAYGATVIEIVRRKEFSRFFYQRAQSILEVMAKLSANERKRRQVHRGEVLGQLPFTIRGMDDPVPTIDFSPTGSVDSSYSLERDDVDGIVRILDELEDASRAENDPMALTAIRECRIALDKLVVRMDGLEANFDRIAERSLLSASRLSMSRRRSTEADEQAIQELVQQLQEATDVQTRQESLFKEERYGMQGQIHRLQAELREAQATVSTEQTRAERLERELEQLRAHVETESNKRRIVEDRNGHLSDDMESQRQELAIALADATEQTKIAESLRQELSQARADFEDVKTLESRNGQKVALLLEDQANNLRLLEEARARGEDLEEQIKAARAESTKVDEALKEASRDKDRLLRAQATEHDRIIRDHIAEADGDRAVLERQFHELKAVQEHTLRQLDGARAEVEVATADAQGKREELARIERELREARHAERVLREDLRAGRASQSSFEQRLEDSGRLVAQILDVALAFRNAHVKALQATQLMNSHPGTTAKSTAGLAESFSPSIRHGIISQLDEPSPIDPSEPATALEVLRSFDHDHFLEAITKTGSTIRKWQKQCKEYRERAKGKISFRNFAKGDLALFLPTRNSVSKPWAAFNVSFPHYFLQATGHLAEQLKTREWIVARITSITERVVDHNDASSNPYGLGDGVKYYMLEVEDWTQNNAQNKRRPSSRKTSRDQPPLSTAPAPAVPPDPAETEDTFMTNPPASLHLFPVRARTSLSTSPPVRPSSLSRLLAQAPSPLEPPLDPEPEPSSSTNKPDSPSSPPPPTSPSQLQTGLPGSIPQHVASPLRPGSRASRISTTSRFSVGRIPGLGSASSGSPVTKAPPTTALAGLSASPSSPDDANPFRESSASTPSPNESVTEGVSNVLRHSRRRTTSYHVPRTSPLAPSIVSESTSTSTVTARPAASTMNSSNTLANFASSWGMSFGRKKKAEVDAAAVIEDGDHNRTLGASSSTATEMLKRF